MGERKKSAFSNVQYGNRFAGYGGVDDPNWKKEKKRELEKWRPEASNGVAIAFDKTSATRHNRVTFESPRPPPPLPPFPISLSYRTTFIELTDVDSSNVTRSAPAARRSGSSSLVVGASISISSARLALVVYWNLAAISNCLGARRFERRWLADGDVAASRRQSNCVGSCVTFRSAVRRRHESSPHVYRVSLPSFFFLLSFFFCSCCRCRFRSPKKKTNKKRTSIGPRRRNSNYRVTPAALWNALIR